MDSKEARCGLNISLPTGNLISWGQSINEHLSAIQTDHEGLKAKIKELQTILQALVSQQKSYQQTQQGYQKKLATLRGQIAAVSADDKEILATQLRTLEAEIVHLKAPAVSAELASQLHSLQQEYHSLKVGFEQSAKASSIVRSQLQGVIAESGRQAEQFATWQQELAQQIEQQTKKYESELADLQVQLSQTKIALSKRVAVLEGRVGTLEVDASQLKAQVGMLETKESKLNIRMGGVETKVDSLQQRFEAFSAKGDSKDEKEKPLDVSKLEKGLRQIILKKLKNATLRHLEDFEDKEIAHDIFVFQRGMLLEEFERKLLGIGEVRTFNDEKKHADAQTSRRDFNIIDAIEREFLSSDKYSVLLLTGDAGSGKSKLARELVRSVCRKFEIPDAKEAPIPVYIQLLAANLHEPDLLRWHLINDIGLTVKEIMQLKETMTTFILVLDGFDEISEGARDTLIKKIVDAHWPNKLKIMVASRRMGYSQGESEDAFIAGSGVKGSVLKYHILPFEQEQICQYLTDYETQQANVKQNILRLVLKEIPSAIFLESVSTIFSSICSYYLWTKENYQKALRDMPGVGSVIQNPYMLSQVVEELPRIVAEQAKEKKAVEHIRLTRLGIYDHFTRHYFKRQLKTLNLQQEKNLGEKLQKIRTFHNIPVTEAKGNRKLFVRLYQIYTQKLAYELFSRRQNSVCFDSAHPDWQWAQKYYDGEDTTSSYHPFTGLVRLGCPLRPLGNNRFTFMHQSLIEFFGARYLFDSVLTKGWIMSDVDLNSSCLVDIPVSEEQRRKLGELKSVAISQERKELKEPMGLLREPSREHKKDNLDEDIELSTITKGSAIPDLKRSGSLMPIVAERIKPDSMEAKIIENHDGTILSVIDFLAQHAKENKEFRDALLDIIHVSKHVPHIWKASANAYTILNKSGFNFGGMKLRGTRLGGDDGVVCWGADMSRSLCHGTDFGGSDGRYVTWTDAWVADANFSDSCMDGASFGELPFINGKKLFYSSKDKKMVVFDYENKDSCNVTLSSDAKQLAWTSVHYGWPLGARLKVMNYANNNIVLENIYSFKEKNAIQLNSLTTKSEHVLEGHTDRIWFLAYNPTKKQLASASADRSVILWNTEAGTCWRLLLGHSSDVMSVSYSSDGQQLVSGSRDKTIRLWETLNGFCLRVIKIGNTVTSLSYRPMSHEIAVGSENGEISLWSTDEITARPLHVLRGHAGPVTHLVYRADGLELVSASKDQTARIWTRVDDARCIQILEVAHLIHNLNYLDDKQLGLGDGEIIRVRELFKRQGISPSAKVHKDSISSISYRYDGKEIATASNYETAIRLWSVETGKCSKELKGHMQGVTCLSYERHGLLLVSGSKDCTVRLWATGTQECLQVLSSRAPITCLDSNPNKAEVLIGMANTAMIWSFEANKKLAAIANKPHCYEIPFGRRAYRLCESIITAVKYHPNGGYIAIGNQAQEVNDYTVPTGAGVGTTLSVPEETLYFWIPSHSPEHIETYETWWGRTWAAHDYPTNTVTSIAYSKNGLQLAIGYYNSNIHIYFFKTHKKRCDKTKQLSARATSVDFSANNKLLVSAHENEKEVKIWSIENTNCQLALEIPHPVKVQHVKWSPEEEKKPENSHDIIYSLVTGSYEGAVRLWQVKENVIKGPSAKSKSEQTYSHTLIWQTHSTLFSHGAGFSNISGVREQSIPALLLQRGAKCVTMTTCSSADVMKKKNKYNWHPTGVLLYENKIIDKDGWVIVLARKKATDDKSIVSNPVNFNATSDAKLIIYGMEFDHELQQHYVVTKEIHLLNGRSSGFGFFGNATIQIRDVILEELQREKTNLVQKSWQAPRVIVDKLIMNVIHNQRKGAKYFVLGSMYSGHHNSLSYCEEKLREIEIDPSLEKWHDVIAVIPERRLPDEEKSKTCVIS